jgi:uncharacterized protein
MQQLSIRKSVLFHLYPGIIITLGFILLAPLAIKFGFPPQFAMLVSILLIAVPILVGHLVIAKKRENKSSIYELNGFDNQLSTARLILYSIALVIFGFIVWGGTQPINLVITDKLLYWLPDWFTVMDFSGYDDTKIFLTLIVNLILNGFVAPYIEEMYFRGYLLPRMNVWGTQAFVANALLFSLYHFWQPNAYLPVLLVYLPITYFVWRTKDLRLAILTHTLLNVLGALLSLDGFIINYIRNSII